MISSCSTLSKKECMSVDWFELGIKDANSGEKEPLTSEHEKSCSKHNLKIKVSQYLKGYKVGLKTYCTKETGRSRGESGDSKHIFCEELNPSFKTAYDKAFLEYSKEKAIEELKKTLIEDNGGKECTFSSDCEVSNSCSFNRCDKSGKECSDDSDCTYETDCSSVSDWTEYSDYVSVDVCSEN